VLPRLAIADFSILFGDPPLNDGLRLLHGQLELIARHVWERARQCGEEWLALEAVIDEADDLSGDRLDAVRHG